ncbi:hypothetical protein [Methylomagnum sp.]
MLVITFLLAGMNPTFSAPLPRFLTPLEFALVGDYNYGPLDGPKWRESERMIAAINASRARFTVHLGDIQPGNAECADTIVEATRRQFAAFRAPLIYLFGDNEWTDCHRYAAINPRSPFVNPLERLAHLRRAFYVGNRSQGTFQLRLERQADRPRNPAYRQFVENVRWQVQDVLFVGVNVPGSNNNYSGGPGSPQTVKVPGQDAEWAVRNGAVIDWLRDSFHRAKVNQVRAVVILWQANPDFESRRPELPRYDSDGFRDLKGALASLTAGFAHPVVLAHGDSHAGFRVDRPLPLPNFLRVENYGDPATRWTKVTVLPNHHGLDMFRFQGMRVPGNP